MKLSIVYLLLIIISIANCFFIKRNTIQIIDITSYGQFFSLTQESILEIGNTTRIVFKNKYRLYITPHIKLHTKNIFDQKGQLIDEKVVKMDTSYRVYALSVGNKQGLKYTLENFKTEKGTIFNADSLISEVTFTDTDFKKFEYELGTPSSVVSKGGMKIEKYAVKKTSLAEIDSVYRYYDKDLRDIDFSYSKKLDEQNQSKLYKTTFIFNKIPKGIGLPDTEIPRRENWFEMKRGADKNPEKLEKVFEKFKKDSEKLSLK